MTITGSRSGVLAGLALVFHGALAAAQSPPPAPQSPQQPPPAPAAAQPAVSGNVILAPNPYAAGYAPPGYYPPPGYAPMYVQPSRRGMVVPYNGGPVPPDAHLERRPITGLVAAGASVFAVPYAISLFIGIACVQSNVLCRDTTLAWLMMPVAGPFISAALAPSSSGVAVLIFDGILQVGGAAMLIAGLAAQRRVLVYHAAAGRPAHRPRWAVLPGPMPGGGAGLNLVGTSF